jgi:hypothetical protein
MDMRRSRNCSKRLPHASGEGAVRRALRRRSAAPASSRRARWGRGDAQTAGSSVGSGGWDSPQTRERGKSLFMTSRTIGLVGAVAVLLLTGCTYVVKPRVEAYYDEHCDIEFKKATLTVEQQEAWFLGHCSDKNECAAMLIANVAVTPVSAIVSGSIVVVGNTYYWLQKTGRCIARDEPGIAS